MTRLTPERKREIINTLDNGMILSTKMSQDLIDEIYGLEVELREANKHASILDRSCDKLHKQIDELRSYNRSIMAEREGYKTAAHEWMIQYDKLKDKYEPTEWVTSEGK